MKLAIKSILLASVFFICTIQNSIGSDHADGPFITKKPAGDITDMYAWMEDTSTVNLIMNVFPGADTSSKFSDTIDYIFHVNSSSSYGNDQTEVTITCQFSSDQRITCKTPTQTLISNVDASSTSGTSNTDGTFKIFTGLRKDPAFFDAENFELARKDFITVAAGFSKDSASCPSIDDTNRDEIRSTYTGSVLGVTGTNSPAVNSYKSSNVLSIVIQASKKIVGSGPILSVWGSTNE